MTKRRQRRLELTTRLRSIVNQMQKNLIETSRQRTNMPKTRDGVEIVGAMKGRIVEEGWALFCVDGPREGGMAVECLGLVTRSKNDKASLDVDNYELLNWNECTAFRVGKYRIVEVL